MIVTMIQYTELLWEMSAKRRGQKMRWRTVIVLETIKYSSFFFFVATTDELELTLGN